MSREVPDGWRLARLHELSKLAAGGTPARARPDYYDGDIPWLKSGEINQGRIWATEEKITKKGLAESSAKLIPAGTPVVAMYGATAGVVGFLEITAAINQAVLAVQPTRELLDADFCLHMLSYQAVNLLKLTQGSGQPNLSKALIENLEVSLPPLHEQRRIAEILSSVDEAIAATRAVIEQTRKVKQAVLERLLTKGIGHTRFKQTEIREIPEGWEVAELRSLLASSTYGLNTPMEPEPIGIPVLRMGNIQDSEISLTGLKYAALDDETKTKYDIRRGDILFNRTNSRELVGKVAIAREDLDASFASYLIRLRVNEDNDPFFVHSVLSSSQYQSLLRSISTPGASQANINATKLGSVLLPVPKIEEQRKIVLTMDGFLMSETANLRALSELEATKSALMSDLFTGRKRVTDALPLAAE